MVAAFKLLGKDSTRFRNRPLTADKTTKSYEIHRRQSGRFVALKGNYKSMLMLRKRNHQSVSTCGRKDA